MVKVPRIGIPSLTKAYRTKELAGIFYFTGSTLATSPFRPSLSCAGYMGYPPGKLRVSRFRYLVL
jgi:hypothetical protein